MKSQFLLDPTITFLNHGSFGACPKPIFEEYQRLQSELESEPVYFIQKKKQRYI
jgi:isopenicillin-N epimerase